MGKHHHQHHCQRGQQGLGSQEDDFAIPGRRSSAGKTTREEAGVVWGFVKPMLSLPRSFRPLGEGDHLGRAGEVGGRDAIASPALPNLFATPLSTLVNPPEAGAGDGRATEKQRTDWKRLFLLHNNAGSPKSAQGPSNLRFPHIYLV